MNNEQKDVSNENALVASVERYMNAERGIDEILMVLIQMKMGVKYHTLKGGNGNVSTIMQILHDNFETISNKDLWK